MKQATLASQLMQFLRSHHPGWVHRGVMERMQWKNQKNFTYYLPSNVSKTLRTLEYDGIIAVRDDEKRKSVEHRYLYEHERDTYIPQHIIKKTKG